MPLIRNTGDRTSAHSFRGEPASLASPSASERWLAARASLDPADISTLTDALVRESDARVREAIFTSLARISTLASATAVLPYLRHEDANIRRGAMDALRAMPQALAPLIPNLLADADPDVRVLACDLVRDAEIVTGASLLCALIENERQANVCAAAIDVLGEIGDATALGSLARCAEHYPSDPFLSFAIKVVADRLRIEMPASRD